MVFSLQLFGKVRLSEQDPENSELKAIQKVQNKMARYLNSRTLCDFNPVLFTFHMANR